MLVIAHRGALWEALENSYSAFDKALEAGCDRIELDLWAATDYSLWVCHDEDLKRTTSTTGLITKLSSDDLHKVKLTNGEPLPNLNTLLKDYLPKVELNLELKDSREEAVVALINKISDHKLNSKIIISSFDKKPLELLAKKAPHIKLALLWEGPISLDSEAFALLEQYPNWIFHPEANTLTENICEKLLEKNKIIYPWVARLGIEEKQKEKLWQKMVAFKVHGLCTNYPREFRQWLNQN